MISVNLLLKAIIAGVVWGVCYLYIRRYLNPENKKDVTKYKMDTIYGSFASAVAVIAKELITPLILS